MCLFYVVLLSLELKHNVKFNLTFPLCFTTHNKHGIRTIQNCSIIGQWIGMDNSTLT